MSAQPTHSDTKQSLLDAAEELIAAHGVTGASLRAITSRAGVNLAAANYHFGSKEELVRSVVARHLEPINRERLCLLDAVEAAPGGMELEALVRAFVAPVVRFGYEMPDRGRHFKQIWGQALVQPDPTLRQMLLAELREVIRRFSAAFARALPHLDRAELMWRLQFMVGAMAHTVAGTQLIDEVTAGLCDTRDLEGLLDRLVRFLSAGLLAPAGERGSAAPVKEEE